jgi:hypothetical protein
MSKVLDRIKATDKRVDDIEDNGPDEMARYWVHLKPGYYSPMDDSHTITGETIREVRQALAIVEECQCEQCKAERVEN